MATTSALLEAAYTKVSLLADAAWAPCSMGPMGVPLTGPTLDPNASIVNACGARAGVAFRRANQDLWLRCVNLDRYIRENQCVSPKSSNGNNLSVSTSSMNCGQNNGWYRYKVPVVGSEEKSGEKSHRPRTVKDTIPLSRLASYGGQVAYNEERERLYTADEGNIYAVSPIPPMDSKIPDEPWLLSAVEDVFKRLTTLPERAPRSQRKYEEYYVENCGNSQAVTTTTPPTGPECALTIIPHSHRISRCSSSELLQELPPQMRYQNGSVSRDEAQSNCAQLQHNRSEPHLSNVQRYTLTNHEEVRLQMKIRAPAVQDLWSKINNQVRLGQSFPQLQIQKARQMNHHNHQHGQHQQMLPSNGRLSRHRSLSRFPMLQMQNLPLPQLNAEVPEFYPKTNSGPPFGLLMGPGSNCSAGIADCGGINTSRLNNVGNAVTILLPPANELAYQDELFPYRSERDNAHHHKLQAMDHVAGILARPPATGTLPMAPQTRPNNPWFLSNSNTSGKPTSTSSLLPTGPSPVSLPPPAPPPAPPPPYKSLKATRHSTRNGKMQFQSIPIPVYQRPPEFYTQQNEAATNGNGTGGSIGTRRRTGGSGVDFSNLILLTRGGKGHNRQSTSSVPSTANSASKTESFTSDAKSNTNRPVTSERARTTTESTPSSSVHEIPSTQINPSSEDVFQWLNAAFGSGKSKDSPQVGGGQTTQTAALDVVGLPQDLAVTYPPRVSADIYTDETSAAGTRRRLYRDVLTHPTCAAPGEDTATSSSRTTSPVQPSRSGDKFDLLEEEALMQYHSSDDSLTERAQSQILRRVEGGMSTSTSTLATATLTSSPSIMTTSTTSSLTTSTSVALITTTLNTIALTTTASTTTVSTAASTGTTQSTAQSPTKQRRFKDLCGCKTSAATPPPPPPAPPGDEVQSPRRRLYRDVLAHRRAGPSPETSGSVNGPRDSASWSDVLKRLEEQALMEYRLSDDAACATRETSQRTSEEALTRRYQDLERQALMQYLRGNSSNSEVQAGEGDSLNDHNQRGRSSANNRNRYLHRVEEDVMVNLKLLQREKSRASPSKFQPNRTFNVQDNQPDRRVYRKQLAKITPQPQQELQVQQLQHCHETSNSNKFVQMSAPHAPQLMHQQMINNSEIGHQRAHQQLLQEQLTLLHLNQHATQPTFEQQPNPFHQLPQKITPKPPQPEFCLHAQQNFQLRQQPPSQPTLQQPFSQLHLIELQQRLSHPGLSPQQVVELQTLYQHQTFTNLDIDFLQQHKKLKQYPQKATVPKITLQKKTHRRQRSQPKLQQLENQDVQQLELQHQRMASQNVPLMLSLPQIVTPQSSIIEMQTRWQQINSYSCPSSPAPQCGGPLLDPHGDMALVWTLSQDDHLESTAQVTDSNTSLISNSILTVDESSEQRNVVPKSAPQSTGTKNIASSSQDPSPGTTKDELPKAPFPPFQNEQKVTEKTSKKKKKQVKNKKSKNCSNVKNSNGKGRKGITRSNQEKEKHDIVAKCSTSSKNSDCKDYHEERSRSQRRLSHPDSRRSRSCECSVPASLHLKGSCNEPLPLCTGTNNETHLKADREQSRRDKMNPEAKKRRTDHKS